MYKLFGYTFLFLLTATVSLGQQVEQALPGTVLNSLQKKDLGICGTDILLNRLRRDAKFKAAEQKMNRQILNFQRPLDDDSTIVPVVFHIISENPDDIADQFMLDGLKELNDAFSKRGIYTVSRGVDTKIRFCLAKKDPDGGTSSGITRTQSFFAGFLNPAIEDARLKRLIQWDPHRYINIWYIAGMNIESSADFLCGQWERNYMKAYATMPPGGDALDGIVMAEFGNTIIHEMGHYLGLYHTFEGRNCINNDCKTDGDMVCDTPPEASIANSSCINPENSCSTDTLSNFSDGNFTTNVPDQVANFMDYGNDACHNEFTKGQADRMNAAIKTQRAGLLENECDKPCNDNIVAAFTRSNPYPLPGNMVNFTNGSAGAAAYQWLVNGAVVSTATNFTYTFPDTGRYKISLKAANSATCFAVYSDFVTVTCGVAARFYSDKRVIASKLPLYPDSIRFTNTSENASSYQWLMSNDSGMEEKVISTAKDLVYIFPTPAIYFVRLVATNGTCIDTTGLYTVTVLDPTPDGVARMSIVDCYEQTRVRITFSVCNAGYAVIPSGIPVSFYDADPRLGNAHKLGNTFFLPDSIPGQCCGPSYVYIVDVQHEGLNNLYMVFNDSGNTAPLVLPNTPFAENIYANNIVSEANFSFKTSIVPAQATLEPGDTLQLTGQAGPGAVASYAWSTSKNLSCTDCTAPYLVADSDRVKRLIATSVYGCVDTAFADIKVPPANDYTIELNEVQCAAGNKLHINFTLRNSFKRGILPQGLRVSFYEGDPATDTAHLLSPVFSIPSSFPGKEADFSTLIENIRPGKLYAVVNDNGVSVPVQLPNTLFPEKDYSNNRADILYQAEMVQLQPQDTTVLKKSSYALTVSSTIYNPASINWFNGNGYMLNCNRCPSPVVTIADSGLVTMQMENRYGCLIRGSSAVKIISPDMTIRIIETKCYSNSTTLVKFSICMNNNYDQVLAGIPVAFYDASPSGGGAKLLSPVFYTPGVQAGNCYAYQHIISTPATRRLYAVVNDNGTGGRVYDETNYENNGSDSSITEFTVRIEPADTSIARSGSVQLIPVVSGGALSSFLWKDDATLSCLNCLSPIANPQYTREYALVVQNEYACTDTAYAIVKTYTGGLINIPSAFSPNYDGLNDIFYVLGGADVRIVKEFQVFNRWGEKVFQMKDVLPNDPRYGWDGTQKGVPAAPGAYVYLIKTGDANGKQQLFKGTIILLR